LDSRKREKIDGKRAVSIWATNARQYPEVVVGGGT
jgi:hypothetical protein